MTRADERYNTSTTASCRVNNLQTSRSYSGILSFPSRFFLDGRDADQVSNSALLTFSESRGRPSDHGFGRLELRSEITPSTQPQCIKFAYKRSQCTPLLFQLCAHSFLFLQLSNQFCCPCLLLFSLPDFCLQARSPFPFNVFFHLMERFAKVVLVSTDDNLEFSDSFLLLRNEFVFFRLRRIR